MFEPQGRTFIAARDALCSGDLDFVFTRDGLGAFSWAYPDGFDRAEMQGRNYPSGEPWEEASKANQEPKQSSVQSGIAVVLQQHGLHAVLRPEQCSNAVCYEPT